MSLNYFYKGASLDLVYKVDAAGSTVSGYTNAGAAIKFKAKTVDIETQNIAGFAVVGVNFDSSFCSNFSDFTSTTTTGDNGDPGSSTSGSFVVPPDCTKIKCILIGAGGGSSQSQNNPQGAEFNPGRGGGGAFIVVQFSVTGGQTVNYTVGNRGGLGTSPNKAGGTGGSTTMNGYIARGGQYGDGGNITGANGAGGTFTLGSGGTVLYSATGNGVGQNNGYKLFSKGTNLPNESTFTNPNVGQGGGLVQVGNYGFIRVYFIYN